MENTTYTIKEASEMLELENHTLRYYEDTLELQVPRNAIGHRYYRKCDIAILRHIINLKEQGLQLKAIREAIKGYYDAAGDTDWEEEGETYLQAITALEMVPKLASSQGRGNKLDITDTNNNKVEQFRMMMKDTFVQAIDENQEELKSELNYHIKYKIEEDLQQEIEKMEEIYEEKDKEHYRKIDEAMREMQKVRDEMVGISGQKGGKKKKKEKKEKKEKRSLLGRMFGKREQIPDEYILDK